MNLLLLLDTLIRAITFLKKKKLEIKIAELSLLKFALDTFPRVIGGNLQTLVRNIKPAKRRESERILDPLHKLAEVGTTGRELFTDVLRKQEIQKVKPMKLLSSFRYVLDAHVLVDDDRVFDGRPVQILLPHQIVRQVVFDRLALRVGRPGGRFTL